MPTKRLPAAPSLENLKAQARDLISACAAADPPACQRLREFHPWFAKAEDETIARSRLTWSDALFAIAREYGFASWPRLKAVVESGGPDARSLRDRIDDAVLGAAVDALDDGDLARLRSLLETHPDLVRRRARYEGENYFREPSLLMFAAENPVRNDCLPPNIVELTRLILDAGADRNRADVDETLGLVVSGRVAREAGVQPDLMVLLVGRGADPSLPLNAALAHGELDAARRLLLLGAPMTLAAAAALGDVAVVGRLLPAAGDSERQLAMAFAAQHGRDDALRRLLEAGADPSRFNPPGAHAHSTPLHQAAFNGHQGAVRALLEHGARRDLRDTLWSGTPADWARHAGRPAMVALLEAHDAAGGRGDVSGSSLEEDDR